MFIFPSADLVQHVLLRIRHDRRHTAVAQRRRHHAQVLAAQQRRRGAGVAHPVRGYSFQFRGQRLLAGVLQRHTSGLMYCRTM